MKIKNSIQFLLLGTVVLLLSGFDKVKFQQDNADFLKIMKGVQIEVVAPASGKPAEIMRDLQNLPGMSLDFPAHCFKTPTNFHSAPDKLRGQCLKEALLSKKSDIVWALRGGYGSPKLIEELAKLEKPARAKYFIGYSDITVLHIFLAQGWGWKTIHGSGIAEIIDNDKARENFVKIANIVTGKVDQAVISGLALMNKMVASDKEVKGTLTGGNLTMVVTTIGTPWQIKTNDKILFLEEVGIKPYQLDRTLYHLKHAGLLDNIKAIIFGEFGEPKENLQILQDFANQAQVPVFKTNRFGHSKYNDPIVYNSNGFISLQKDKTFDLKMTLK